MSAFPATLESVGAGALQSNRPKAISQVSPLELWGGLECSVARIGDEWRDQVVETGHDGRPEDLEPIAALGIRTLRYPVLWERVAPRAADQYAWTWSDDRLQRLRRLEIEPIVGLLHHGSGPHYTNLLQDGFPSMFAAYARRVAERYPWISAYTPINEPLTTARFSALYGHWYPHHRSPGSFARALVNQCRATVLAMKEIRAVNPNARLVQTEDMGKVFATPNLQRQADFENERRWLSLDLLSGTVDRGHALFSYLIECGIGERELFEFTENPCTPDIFGINHYVTSERFLDEDLGRYPADVQPRGAGERYVDVAAVRAGLPLGSLGLVPRLHEVWARYRATIAITEVHLGCTREEQVRWLAEAWGAAELVRSEGVDLRAVTAWALLGGVDWSSLLTIRRGDYEPGAFDIRSIPPRPTALATTAHSLATRGRVYHPVLDGHAWWNRAAPRDPGIGGTRPAIQRPLLVTGATGTLGTAFARMAEQRGLACQNSTRAELDIAEDISIARALERHRPWAVINCAGYVDTARAHLEVDRCFRENARGAHRLAVACSRLRIPFVTFSSDLVFDGTAGRPYAEADRLSPVCTYGSSKAAAEELIGQDAPQALIVRTSAFFGPWDTHNFVYRALSALSTGASFQAPDDVFVSPTYVPDLVSAALDLLIDGESGLWHLANAGSISWYELAALATEVCGVSPSGLRATQGAPRDTTLRSNRGQLLASLEDAIGRYLRESRGTWEGRLANISAVA